MGMKAQSSQQVTAGLSREEEKPIYAEKAENKPSSSVSSSAIPVPA